MAHNPNPTLAHGFVEYKNENALLEAKQERDKLEAAQVEFEMFSKAFRRSCARMRSRFVQPSWCLTGTRLPPHTFLIGWSIIAEREEEVVNAENRAKEAAYAIGTYVPEALSEGSRATAGTGGTSGTERSEEEDERIKWLVDNIVSI